MKNEYCTQQKGGYSHKDTYQGKAWKALSLLLGQDLDKQIKDYIKYLCERTTAINAAIVIAAGEGIIMKNNTLT